MKRFAAVAAAVLVVAAIVVTQVFAAGRKDNDTLVQLLAINDFHGNLQPPSGSSGRITTGVGQTVDAGGVAYLATWLNTLEQGSPNETTVRVGAGDLIGASPLISGLFHDEPTIEAMNTLDLDVTGVGNHEFDEGLQELLRMQFGNQLGGDGCHPVDGCQDGSPFGGSLFQYLAANVYYHGTSTTILPPYEIKKIGNAKIAFVGLTLEGTPLIVTPAGVAGLDFKPEVATVNSLVQLLRANEGVRTFVVLIHQGGQQNPPYPLGYQDVNRCDNPTGDIFPIVQALDPQVDVVISAHTHQPYICTVDGKLVTSASSFGRLITDIDLRIDHQTKDVTAATARNVIVTRGVTPDAGEQAIIDKYNTISAPIANRVIGSITGDITRTGSAAGESALGDVIADAQLASTSPTDFGGAVVAFMNPGGIRADLTYANSTGGELPGEITYNELYTVQPFSNVMTVKTLTGAQIEALLEQQWCGSNLNAVKFLQVSAGFSYTYDGTGLTATQNTNSDCDRVNIADIAIGGVPVGAATQYRVAMNNFLATGGDGFTIFNQGTDQLGGEVDLDAAVNYFMHNSPVAPGPQNRITRVG
jgi:5'-nucleotidase